MTDEPETDAPDAEGPTPAALLAFYAVLAMVLIAVFVIVGVYGV